MKLYINVTQLSRFETLYRNNEDLRLMVDRETGIRWAVDDSTSVYELERILVRNGIRYQLDGTG